MGEKRRGHEQATTALSTGRAVPLSRGFPASVGYNTLHACQRRSGLAITRCLDSEASAWLNIPR
jgi:hypothetical protein